ncbi:MAG: MFS transporter [Phycisphaerales bacterium]|nr:MFS transporter [Phycisphaerales bacterium]
MLGVAVLLALATMPSQTVIVSLFNASYREKLGLSVADLSLAYTIGTLVAAVPLSWVGRAADRFGIRVVAGTIVVAYTLALMFLTIASHAILLGFGFFLIRFLGQGSLGMLSGHTIAMWFERRLGVAHSVLTVGGFAAGSAILPKPVAWMITNYGATKSLMLLALGVFVCTMPAIVFLFRNKPEDIGQFLDGDDHEHATHDVMHGGRPPANDPAFTAAQARATLPFWILLTVGCTSGCIGTALLFHMQTMIERGGAAGTEDQAASANQAWAMAFGIGLLCVGWMADKFRPRFLLPIAPAFMLAGSLVCWRGATGRVDAEEVVGTMTLGMVLFGIGMAFSVAVSGPAVARYFGRTHHGSIRGFMTTFGVAATGIAPFLAGFWYERAGEDFGPVLIGFAVWCVPLFFATMLLNKPTPPTERDLEPEPDRIDMQDVEL